MIDKLINQLDLSNLEPISGMDATFLYGETPTSPMHVGSVAIIEGSLDFETFRATIASKIHHLPSLRKKLIEVPLSIDYPYWADDPDFNLDLHISHIALPKPGDWKALRKLAASIFSKHLDHTKPLWSMHFVEGLDEINQVPKGSVALITKIHHVAIDGMAGAGMMGMLFDFTEKSSKLKPPKPYAPKPLPDAVSVLAKSALSFIKAPLKLPTLISSVVQSTVKAGFATRIQHAELPTAPFTAPRTPFNTIISAERRWNASLLSLDRIKHLKNVMGTTMNDVILAICSGALRAYLLEKEKLPKKSLVAMIPISTRAQDDKTNKGNQISNMLVQLATQIEDPIKRLETIHENTQRGKTYQAALGAKTIAGLGEMIPYSIAFQASRIYSRYNLSNLHKPVFNVVITNVPGPQFPLYMHGHKLQSLTATAPILDGMGLIITIFSYNGEVAISLTSDANSMPDLNTFNTMVRDSANELEKVVLAHEKQLKKKAPAKKVAAKSDKYFEHLRKYLKSNPKAAAVGTGKFQFEIGGTAESQWHILLDEQPGTVRRGKTTKPDATFKITDNHLMKLANKQLQVETAMVQGRLKVSGDLQKAMKLGVLLEKLPELTKPKKS